MIYISTGGFTQLTGYETSKLLIDAGLNKLELSGGKYDCDVEKHLMALPSDSSLRLHNYFPPPKGGFVVNLASVNDEIYKKSMLQLQSAIQLSAKLEAPVFAFHAGFLTDIKISELGSRVKARRLADREIGKELFIHRVHEISEFANDIGVQLLIENNVLSPANMNEFNGNPLLMVTPDEIAELMERLPVNTNLLLDVAHLKVSAHTIGFDLDAAMKTVQPYIQGYHLSDNDGTADSNDPVTEDSWFWKWINPDLNYYTLEVYSSDTNILKEQIEMVRRKLSYSKS